MIDLLSAHNWLRIIGSGLVRHEFSNSYTPGESFWLLWSIGSVSIIVVGTEKLASVSFLPSAFIGHLFVATSHANC